MIKKLVLSAVEGFWYGEAGITMSIALIFMALAVPMVAAALSLSSTLSIDSRVKTDIAKGQYATIGGNEHGIYRLLHEPGYVSSLAIGAAHSYSLNLNKEQVTVSILKRSNPPGAPPPASADDSRRLQTFTEVTPTAAAANTKTTFTFTIRVENRDDDPENLTKIHDELPPGFSYVHKSTTGFITSNPTISGQHLQWALGSPKTLQPRQSVTISFKAQANLSAGNYCNEAWVEPGLSKTSSGKTAKITVGSPPNNLCPGVAVRVAKTVDLTEAVGASPTAFTYTITVENTGTAILNLTLLQDLLHPGFTYVSDSTSGDLTLLNPTVMMPGARQHLQWNFVPKIQIQPGETRSLAFQAQATVVDGNNWNETWATFDEFLDPKYTWPTAVIHGFGSFEVTATNGENTTSSEIWIGSDSHRVKQWNLAR